MKNLVVNGRIFPVGDLPAKPLHGVLEYLFALAGGGHVVVDLSLDGRPPTAQDWERTTTDLQIDTVEVSTGTAADPLQTALLNLARVMRTLEGLCQIAGQIIISSKFAQAESPLRRAIEVTRHCRDSIPNMGGNRSEDVVLKDRFASAIRSCESAIERCLSCSTEGERRNASSLLLNDILSVLSSLQNLCRCPSRILFDGQSSGRTVFIDGGAHSGESLNWLFDQEGRSKEILIAPWVDKVVFVEPTPDYAPSLSRIRHPKIEVAFENVALFSESGSLDFYRAVDVWGDLGNSLFAQKGSRERMNTGEPVRVQTAKVDAFIERVTRPDDYVILKLDIEGAEFDVLSCLLQNPQISRRLKEVYIEWHAMDGKLESRPQLEAGLRALGIEYMMWPY